MSKLAGTVCGIVCGKDVNANKLQLGSLLNPLIPEYQTIYDAFATKPSREIKILQNAMLKTIVDSGAWSVLDWFVCLAGETESESRLDWKSLLKTCVNGGSGNVFTPLKGIKGNGSGWLRSGFIPSIDGVHIGLNNCTYGFFSNLDIAYSDQTELSANYLTGNNTALYSKFDATKAYASVHKSSVVYVSGNVATRNGCYIAERATTNVLDYYKNNALVVTGSITPNYIPDKEIILLANAGGTTSRSQNELSFAFAGGSLTAPQKTAITNALTLYNDSVSYFFEA